MDFRFFFLTLLLGTFVIAEDPSTPGSCSVEVFEIEDEECTGDAVDTFNIAEGKCSEEDTDFYMANSIGSGNVIFQVHASDEDCKNGLGGKATAEDGECFELEGVKYKVTCPEHTSKTYATTHWNENSGTVYVSDICQPDNTNFAKFKCYGYGRVKEVYTDDKCTSGNLDEQLIIYDGSDFVCGDDLPSKSYIEYIDEGLGCKYKIKGDFNRLDTCITTAGFKYTVKGEKVIVTTYKNKEDCTEKDTESELDIGACNDDEVQDRSHYISVTGSGMVPKVGMVLILLVGLLMM